MALIPQGARTNESKKTCTQRETLTIAGFANGIGHKSIWVEPKLLAEIQYRARSANGVIRHEEFRLI